MKVEAHIMAWNEAETIALTLRHYQKFCDRIVLHDNYSDDGTRDIALSMGCDVRLFGKPGVLDDREYTNLKNNCWKNSDADWVIVVDADEILDISKQELLTGKIFGFTIIKTYGWQVMSYGMPKENWQEIKTGYYYENYSKMCCFNPKAIKEINYVHGCHIAKPSGEINVSEASFTLFHYRNVGGPQRLVDRHAMYRKRMSDWNVRWKAGGHYLYEDEQRIIEWEEQFQKSRPYHLRGGESFSHDTQSLKNG